jgi:ferredoxin
MANHHDRYPDNSPGTYYVDDQCIDCDLCRERRPDIFVRNESRGHSYVRRQPAGAAEIAACEEALESCPAEAIGNDGGSTEHPALAETGYSVAIA